MVCLIGITVLAGLGRRMRKRERQNTHKLMDPSQIPTKSTEALSRTKSLKRKPQNNIGSRGNLLESSAGSVDVLNKSSGYIANLAEQSASVARMPPAVPKAKGKFVAPDYDDTAIQYDPPSKFTPKSDTEHSDISSIGQEPIVAGSFKINISKVGKSSSKTVAGFKPIELPVLLQASSSALLHSPSKDRARPKKHHKSFGVLPKDQSETGMEMSPTSRNS